MSNFLRHIFKRLTTSKSKPSHFLCPPQLIYLETRINPAPITVNTLQDTSVSDAFTSLREAIDLANNTAGPDTIVFASSLFTNGPATISLTGVLPAIADATSPAGTLTITGPGANTLNISGNNGNFSVFSVASLGDLTISGVTVSGANNSGFGGGFNNLGSLFISASTITGNSATGGGGIFNQGTSLIISDSTISGNSTSGFGGGINNFNGGTISVSNSTISNNSATNGGGGIVNTNSNLTVSNSTLFGNTTPGFGGGILNTTVSSGSSILNVTNSTLSGNSAGSSNFAGSNGGGIRNDATINNLSNTIIANSVRGGDFVGNAPNTNTNNLVETLGTVTGTFIPAFTADPRLGPLQDNGGPIFTMALGAGSVAIGTTAGTGTDQRGINRTTNDIGAYSFGIQVTSTADSGTGSLRTAITQAGSTPGNDQISVNLTGANPYTITLATSLRINDANTPITGGTAGTVTIAGLGASNLNISGNNGNFSVFTVASGGNLFISGVTVSGAQTSGNGGAFNNSGTLTVSNSTISGNSSSFGGGIYNSGTLTVSNSTISGNSATQNGGGIYNNSSGVLNISNSEISGNSASYGGGILTRGNLTISNSKLSANIANDGNGKGSGGGIRNEGALTILNSTLSGNTAYVGGGISNGSSLTISNSTFFGNSATFGGGIENFGGAFSLNNSTLSGNSAILQGVGRGGAIYNRGVGTISNSTLSGNSAIQPGGGIFNFTGSTLNIANTIIANSTSGGDYAGGGTVTLGSANNLVNQTGLLVSAWATTKNSAEINLGPLQDNGGPTLTMALGAGSVAIGTTAGTGTDQRGINRTTADIGAYSFGIAVNTNSDASIQDSVISLREAITQANNTPGNDGISFNLTGSNTITLASALPTIAKASFAGSVTINGLGVSLLTINGNSSGFNFFNIATGGNLFVSGMTVSGAVFTSGNGGAFNSLGSLTISASTITGNSALNGGAIINQGTSLVVKNSIISNNTTAGYGGGINNYNGGTISIFNSTISGNSATNGGGGIINSNSNLTITDSVFTGNLSATNNGAGVLNTNANSFLTVSGSTFSNNTARNGGAIFNNGTATINSSTISGNINAVKGAGIYNDSTGVLTITDSTISNNASTGNGGGVFNKGSSLNISKSTISGNTSAANGGGVSNNSAGPVTISYSMISSNSAASGAGIYNNNSRLNISNSTISGNSGTGYGGGLNNFNCNANTISVSNSTISNNSATNGGGGIINTNSSLSVSNSTIYGNTTLGNGGGILNFSGSSTLSVTNSTLSGNSATSGGGIQNNATLNNLANTIIANSTSGGDFAGNAPNTNTNNLVETLGTVTGAFIPAFTADPRLGPLQDNGGPTFTMALGAGSPAIITAAGTGTDQRGINRITNDIGAYSFGIAVTNTTDNLTSPSVGSLRAAINLANTTPGNDQISVNLTGANPYTITLAGALPNIVAANTSVSGGTAGTVNITGLGASNLNISGNGGDFSVFSISTGGNLFISGVSVSGANFTSSYGGAFNNSGTLTISNSNLSNNSAIFGGGVYNTISGILNISNSTLSGNSAGQGGGIANNGGTLTVSNSTLSGNSAVSGYGGGIANIGTLTISNSTFSNNSAIFGGGVFNTGSGILNISNSTLSGNSAGQGGGIANNGGTLTIYNSTLSGNSASQGGGIANSGTFNIANTIIANSTTGGDFAGLAPIININNLVETFGTVTGTFTPAFTADPLLGPLQNNGGPTFTMALGAGSPAISATPLVTPNLDQRGFTRSNNDIGAYAYFAPSAAGAIVVAVNTSGQVGLFLSSAGTAITDFHTAFAGSTLTITATRTTGTITGSGTGITIDNTLKTISVNLTLLSVFSGIVIEGNSGADSVTIGVGGVDFSVVTGGGTDQSLVITTGTGADSLTISNAINTKGNSASAYLNSGSISGAGLVTTPTITLVANTGINVSASALAFANISTTSGNIDITNTTGINLPAIAAPANLSINAGGTISQNGLITVVGLATFNAGANPITLTNPSNNFTGAVSLTNTGANNVAIRDVNTINFAASSLGNGTLSVNAVGITQTGAITQVANAGAVTFNAGAGVITLANVGNDFTGLVSVNNSGNNNVSVQDSTDLPIGLSNLGSGTLNLDAGSSGSIKLASNVTSLNGVQNYNSPIILTSNIDLNAGTGSINLPNMISGNFSLTPITANPGLTTISGANTNTTTNVTTGVVQISNTQSTNYVVSGGTLKGTGAIGSLTATGTGIIAPGNSPGKVTSTSLSLSSTNTLQIEIQGASSTPVSGTDYDQIVVSSSGTVNLGGATLSLSTSFTGNQGTVFTIIDNQHLSASIQGTFAGLSEGGVITANGRAYKISYRGGTSSNDVTLTVYDPATVTSFTPTIGKSGTSVVITGTNFVNVSQVSFNGTVQPTYTENSPTQITTTIPSGATTGTISITTIAGTATSSSSITIDNTAPTLSISASPGSLKANETSTITFTFSEVVTGFSSNIITVTNGTITNPVASSSTVYTAIFTPTLGIKADGTISVSNNYFDSVGNQGTAATLTPPIAINTIQTPLVTGSASTTQGGSSVVSLVDPDTGAIIGSAVPFPGFTGELRVVSGDFNNDGKVDIIAAAGPGGGPAIAVLDSQTGEVLQSFFAFDQAFTGGVFIAVRDFNGDGILDIIAGAGAGGGPEVRIFNGDGLTVIRSFFAYAQDFTGGVTVASIDFNNDGILDLVTGAGPGGAPHVKVFDGVTSTILSQWYAYQVSFTGGVYVAAGDIGNDGNIEVVTGAGSGGAPVVAVWDPYTGALLSQFMAYAEDFTGGVRVGVSDGNFDGILDLVTGAGPGGGPEVKGFSFPTLDLLFSFFSGDPSNTSGVFVS
jgi:CSLREA domain-containing protein